MAKEFQQSLKIPALDLVKCQIAVIRTRFPGVRNIIDIGGGSCSIIKIDSVENLLDYTTNSACAAGTGAFLDEQAKRLGFDNYGNLSFSRPKAPPPTIATRCSVFAKTDLIHRQQDGYTPKQLWSGTCKGMTHTLLNTLLKGNPLNEQTAIIGGVALNPEVIHWLQTIYPEILIIPENPHLIASAGAALLAEPQNIYLKDLNRINSNQPKTEFYPWQLTLEQSKFPSFAVAEKWMDENQNEIRVHNFPQTSKIDVFLGIDIGSTSTKLVMIDKKHNVLLDIYRKTAGNPVKANMLLFRALKNIAGKYKVDFNILAAGTTGSGRKMVGEVIGADLIINEITAHVAGATELDPTLDTIFEIGGQDSKYMHVVDGHIRNSNMNYVCAAGTGSFIEEQAGKLGFELTEIGNLVKDITPPLASERCTVFMENDVTKLLKNGLSRRTSYGCSNSVRY